MFAQYEPRAHSGLLVDPVGQYSPLTHAACVAGVAQYDPAAHGTGAVAPGAQYDPLAHGVTTVELQ